MNTGENKEYVVDVLVPVTTVVYAQDEVMAATFAIERAYDQGIVRRIAVLVEDDDSDFFESDSPLQTEVGEG
jgi:hypothetical protein